MDLLKKLELFFKNIKPVYALEFVLLAVVFFHGAQHVKAQ